MEAHISEAQESRRALSLRDIAKDEVARERFRRRLDSYRDELKLLVSEMSGLLAVLNANACEAAGMSQEKLRAALDRVPRERELACEVYSDASVIALLVHTLLKDRACQGPRRCKDEFAAWEEELERYAWFDVHGVAYGSIADDAFAVEPLRQLGQLAARLLNDPDAPAFPLCSRYITADDLALDPDDTLVPASAEGPAPDPDDAPAPGSAAASMLLSRSRGARASCISLGKARQHGCPSRLSVCACSTRFTPCRRVPCAT